MCNCIDETELRLIKHITEQSSDKKDFKLVEGNFTNVPALMFGGEIQMFAYFKYSYTFTRTNGETSKPKTENRKVFFTYCPFCGKQYNTDK